MSVPPEPTGRGIAQGRWSNSGGKRSGGNRGGRGGNRRYNNWDDWNNNMNYRSWSASQDWSAPQDTSDQIVPKGK
eukprot:42345-Karenia_brevis.AAC.1